MLTRLGAAVTRSSSQDAGRKRHHTGPRDTPPASPPPSNPSDTDMCGPGQIAQSVCEMLAPQFTALQTALEAVTLSNARLLEEVAGVKEKYAALEEEQVGLKRNQTRLEARMEDISNKYLETQTVLENLQRTQRAPHAIVFGAAEETNGATPMDTVTKTFEKLPVRDQMPPVRNPIACVRLGKPRTEPNAKPRPIKLIFASVDDKHAALKRGKDLRTKGFNIDVDLTPTQQRERSLKQPRYSALKTQQMSPFWLGSRLMYRSQDGQVREDPGPKPPTPRPTTRTPAPRPAQNTAPSYAQAASA